MAGEGLLEVSTHKGQLRLTIEAVPTVDDPYPESPNFINISNRREAWYLVRELIRRLLKPGLIR